MTSDCGWSAPFFVVYWLRAQRSCDPKQHKTLSYYIPDCSLRKLFVFFDYGELIKPIREGSNVSLKKNGTCSPLLFSEGQTAFFHCRHHQLETVQKSVCCSNHISWKKSGPSSSQRDRLIYMSQFSSPEELEKAHVRDVYDQIAPRFASVQSKAWPKVTEFLLSLPRGSLIADVGRFVPNFSV